MKRLMSIALVLILFCATAHAGGIDAVPDYIGDVLGHAPESMEQAVKANALNLILSDEDQAVISWTDVDKSRVYGVQDNAERLASLYVDLLWMSDWDACTLYVGQKPLAGFNSTAEAENSFTGMDDYEAFLRGYFGIASTSLATVVENLKSSAITYVLNTNTHKFHYPDCPSAKKIKQKNRKEYTGSRDDVIARGYAPCKNCNP